ncbi:MAG: Ig-like domain-containing protein [Oscillospiraceae bacterium]|jgi:hypothetical protein
MGVAKTTICPNCGAEYPAFRAECPNCGMRNEMRSERSPRGSDAVRKGTAASRRAQEGTRWQFIIGLCLVAAVIVAVVLLVTTTLNGSYDKPVVSPSPSPSASAAPSPSPTPTPTPTPTPEVTSLTITFLGSKTEGFTAKTGDKIQLAASVAPDTAKEGVKWSVDNESVIKIDENGLVTAVGTGKATITLECYGKTATCPVIIR